MLPDSSFEADSSASSAAAPTPGSIPLHTANEDAVTFGADQSDGATWSSSPGGATAGSHSTPLVGATGGTAFDTATTPTDDATPAAVSTAVHADDAMTAPGSSVAADAQPFRPST
ncbi:hypothetical protein E2562_016146 [Oryza meyeriana var. granulata]|uniref:Uncharacterized protein n=1 Tax=Oryza meyeriana var. granulata TaxID=110450 RepID=A0A6G1F8L4_9ORYZ|nr:hypothetical protein E2562_016146 [Oryza meyeriana var. granulata]